MNPKDSKELGNVDAFGLDEFGMPAGINPLWGAVAGTGLGTLTAIGVRQFSGGSVGMVKWSEAIGFGVGALASGAMLLSKSTRAAGWTGLASSFLNNGLRQLEMMLLMKEVALPAGTQGVGDVVIEPTDVLAGQGGLGLVEVEPAQALLGNSGAYMEQGSDMPTLVGASLEQASNHIQLVGGPPLSGVASHWGATHFSGRA